MLAPPPACPHSGHAFVCDALSIDGRVGAALEWAMGKSEMAKREWCARRSGVQVSALEEGMNDVQARERQTSALAESERANAVWRVLAAADRSRAGERTVERLSHDAEGPAHALC